MSEVWLYCSEILYRLSSFICDLSVIGLIDFSHNVNPSPHITERRLSCKLSTLCYYNYTVISDFEERTRSVLKTGQYGCWYATAMLPSSVGGQRNNKTVIPEALFYILICYWKELYRYLHIFRNINGLFSPHGKERPSWRVQRERTEVYQADRPACNMITVTCMCL
jgi:hypothetical protein